MKAIRRAKVAEPVKEVKGSLTSLNTAGALGAGENGDPSNNLEWLPPKQLLKPTGQLALNEKELDEELTRILNANNPHAPQNIARWIHKEQTYKAMAYNEHMVTHFEFDGYLSFKGDNKRAEEEAAAPAATEDGAAPGEGTKEEGVDAGTTTEGGPPTSAPEPEVVLKEEVKSNKPPARNQFNYSERATQTVNNPPRSRSTNTEPPPHRTFSGAVNQWSIYDAYMEDTLAKERAKDKAKNAGGKGHKDDDKPTALTTESAHGEDVYHSLDFSKRLSTLERMANQNTYDDITQDFKYWDDAADELRETKEGSLLPLWEFLYMREKKKQVTALAWNPTCSDLFIVAYGSFNFTKQGPGVLCCFSLKNPSFPELIFHTASGVMCIDIHPKRPHLVAAGLYDGSCLVFDLSAPSGLAASAAGGAAGGPGGVGGSSSSGGSGGSGSGGSGNGSSGSGGSGSNGSVGGPGSIGSARYRSNVKEQHADPVWQVAWQPDDLDGNPNFFSVSSDGVVKQAVLLKTELMMSNVIKLALHGSSRAGLCMDFNKSNDHIFVVGTEEGDLIKCSKDYNSQYLQTFDAHSMAVYRILYNAFYTSVFLTASGDWTVKLWDHSEGSGPARTPILIFDFGCPVADVAWAPYSSTVFAVATSEGRVVVYDLDINKYDPICSQQVVGGKARLTRIAFCPFEPVIIVGDDRGTVLSLKLSPNLRKAGRGGASASYEDQRDRLERIVLLSQGKGNSGR
ncbi:hypothetical protein H9P43_000631 [Blastocladiella emersonii ATCC 22665]|nr:hypothetical protein H9P43_000631 [Blastocladiella emersonii ATCC 22665]